MIFSFDQPHILERIVTRLREGGCVAIPTETVYGLAADAANPRAIEKIFSLKGRPAGRPLSVLLANKTQLSDWATNIPEEAWKLAEQFWPGPLTLVLPKAAHVCDVLTAQQNTIGLRVPAHPIALEILQVFGSGLAAPSANLFQHNPPVAAQEVAEHFPEDLWIVDGGVSKVGVASTIVDCTVFPPKILRAGAISQKEISDIIAL